MANEAIEKIREIEAEAENTLAEAENQATNARETASKAVDKILRDAEEKANEIFKEAESKAKAKAIEINQGGIDAAKGKVNNMVSSANPKLDEAADSIIEEILKKWQ